MRATIVTAAVVFVIGCSSPLRQARIASEEALEAGDAVAAAAHLQRACGLAPGDDVCVEARELEARVVREALAVARPLCAQRRLSECLDALRPVRTVSSAPALRQVVDDAARQHRAECDALPFVSEEEVVVRVRCFEALRERVDTQDYTQVVREARERAAQVMETLAASRSRKSVATALATGRLVECLAPSSVRSSVADEAEAVLRAQQQVELSVTQDAPGSSSASVCGRLEGALGYRVTCVSQRRGSGLGLWLLTSAAPMQHTQQTFVRDARYVVRVDRYRNPRYDEKARWVDEDARRVTASDREFRLWQADCESARRRLSAANHCQRCPERNDVDFTCGRAEALERHHQQFESALASSRRELNSLEPILEQEVYDTFRYEEVHHRWSQAFDVTVRAVSGSETRERARRFAASFTGVSRPGFAAAGVIASTASPPESQLLFEQVFPSIVEEAKAAVELDLADREGRAMAACSTGDTECRLRARWYGQPDVFVPWMKSLSERVDARRLPWPSAPCTRGSVERI
jgi:hypothetical protein